MNPGTLTLANVPGGFDVAIRETELGPWLSVKAPVTIPFGQQIRLTRQSQFVGSAELIYEIDGVRIDPEETGESTGQRVDRLVSSPGAKPPFRLATQTRKFV